MSKENLQEELRRLDAEIKIIMNNPDPTMADVEKMNRLCDQVEQLTGEIQTADFKSGAFIPSSRSGPTERQLFEFGEYLQAVAAASTEPGRQIGRFQSGTVYRQILDRETRASGLGESSPAIGGFLIDHDMASEIFRKSQETGRLFSKVRQLPITTNANGTKINMVDETSRANGSRWGGIQGYWEAEAAEKTASKPKFAQQDMALAKIILLCYATDEILQDAAQLGALIYEGFAEEAGFKLDDAIINGTGAGQPLGFLNAACLISVSKESGQAASTILWQNVKKMFARLWGGSFNNALWAVNQDCLPEMMGMSMPIGTGGVPVYQPANLPANTLLTRPVMVMEQAQSLGTLGDIALIDPRQYIMITKGGLQLASSMHVRFVYDEMVFRGVFRAQGQPLWKSALTPYKGTGNTQSPFIALATRS